MPDIQVALVTFPNHPARLAYFRHTVMGLKEKLTASRHTLGYVCSAESERDPTREWQGGFLEKFCQGMGIELKYREGRASLGANMNAAMRMCTAPLILLVQDDWLLTEPLDLSPGADFLLNTRDVDLLRYSWPGYELIFHPNPDGWRRIDPDGPWCYGDDPHLRRQDFMARYGWYREDGPPLCSEGDMVWRMKRMRANICAADKVYFAGIGDVSSVPLDREQRARAVAR